MAYADRQWLLVLQVIFYFLCALSSYFYCKDGDFSPAAGAAKYHFFSSCSESIFLFPSNTFSAGVMPVVLNRNE